jgi:hypothetical protein
MKKDIVYTIRMSSVVREALKTAADKDRRTVSSLLDKIILDYLEREGIPVDGRREERRRYPRKKITLPSTALLGLGEVAKNLPGVILDLSMGGVLVTYPKGTQLPSPTFGELPSFDLCFQLPKSPDTVCVQCEARRMADTGSEIHVGAAFKNADDKALQKLETYLL